MWVTPLTDGGQRLVPCSRIRIVTLPYPTLMYAIVCRLMVLVQSSLARKRMNNWANEQHVVFFDDQHDDHDTMYSFPFVHAVPVTGSLAASL